MFMFQSEQTCPLYSAIWLQQIFIVSIGAFMGGGDCTLVFYVYLLYTVYIVYIYIYIFICLCFQRLVPLCTESEITLNLKKMLKLMQRFKKKRKVAANVKVIEELELYTGIQM